MRAELILLAAFGCGIAGCGGGDSAGPPPAAAAESGFIEFPDPRLRQGRLVWMTTCRGCHGAGVAGAPKAGDKAAWSGRIAQGKPVLYEHALNGFYGPEYTFMPPRGGNSALTDDEVMAAVDYMTALAVDPR